MKSLLSTSLKFFYTIAMPVKVLTTLSSSSSTTAIESSLSWCKSVNVSRMESTSCQKTTWVQERWPPRPRPMRWNNNSKKSNLNLRCPASAWSDLSQTRWKLYLCLSFTRWWRITIFHVCLYLWWNPSHGSEKIPKVKRRNLRIKNGL